MMDLETGTWKFFTLSPPPEVDKPTYEIVGSIEKFNSMEHQFSRIALGDTPLYDEYYTTHPREKEIDEKNREYSDKSGRMLIEEDPINEALSITSFSRAMLSGSKKQLMKTAELRLMPVGRAHQRKVKPDPKQMARKIKAYGLHLGAGKVRVAKLEDRWIYTNEPVLYYGDPENPQLYPYVICLAVPQNPYFIDNHDGKSQGWEVGWTYSYASYISYVIADFIKRLGWNARPIPTASTPYLVPPLYIDCGIGEDSRSGQTVTKEFGNNWRPGGVATDLPLAVDKPVDFGLQDFCDKCGVCADECPSGAISKGDRQIVRGYKKWHIDSEKCYTYWCAKGHACSVCQSVCPWNHSNMAFHNIIRELAQRAPFLRKPIIKGEEIFYSHKSKPEPRWMVEKVDYTNED